MEQALSDIVAAFSQGSSAHLRNQDIKTEVGHAYNKACSLMSHLYDDIRRVHDALPKGQSQNGGIQAIEIHLKQLIYQCRETRDHLHDTARIVNKSH